MSYVPKKRITLLEDELRKAIAAELRSDLRMAEKTKAARLALGAKCTHPEQDREDFRWEHDNGYGRQSMHTGVQCKLCRRRSHYKTNLHWELPEWEKPDVEKKTADE